MDIFNGPELEEALRVFKELHLPFPNESSFVVGSEGGLVFHTDAGVVIRAEKQDSKTLLTDMVMRQYKMMSEMLGLNFEKVSPYIPGMLSKRIVHDHILQPVGSIATEDHLIEIVPGALKQGVTDTDLSRMRRKLGKVWYSLLGSRLRRDQSRIATGNQADIEKRSGCDAWHSRAGKKQYGVSSDKNG